MAKRPRISASEELAGRLRERIVLGDWEPGSRLPPRAILAAEMDACLATMQEAVSLVTEEGFLRVGARKHGTFVAENPPHLRRYRLVFPYGPDDWGQFWRALETAARQRTTPEQEFLCFYGLSGHRDIEEYEAIVSEVQTRRVAGLIFASSANEFKGTPLLDHPGVPRVVIAGAHLFPGIPKIQLDLEDLMGQAMDILVAQGRRRIALLCATHGAMVCDLFRAALTARGLPVCTVREQYASPKNPRMARHVAELMLHAGQAERPDGLIIADDNLITAATEGLARTGIRIPEELGIVAATNFPNIVPAVVPVTRIGFDIPVLLDLLVERLQQVTRGETPPEFTNIRAVPEPPATASSD